MRTANDLVRDFREIQKAQPSQTVVDSASPRERSHPRRRAYAALSLSVLTVIPALMLFGSNITSVLAFEDGQSAASYWQSERARANRARASAPRPSVPARATAYAPAAPARTNPLLSIFGGSRQQATPAIPGLANPSDPAAADPSAKAQKTKRSTGTDVASARTTTGQIMCVRLCDGYFFPAANAPGRGEFANHAAVCSSLCPGAPTDAYHLPAGSQDMSQAYSARRGGKRYSSLPVAFRHQQTFDKTCSCRPQGQPHAAHIPIKRDFTLRKGDAVMTDKGFQVFQGAARWPYRDNDFRSLASARNINKADRVKMRAIERVSAIRPGFGASAQASQITSLPAIVPLPPRRPQISASLRQ
jgi:hypothetical protein